MARSIHSWLGLLFAVPILVIAITGVILATKPVMHSFGDATQDLTGVSVAQVLARVEEANPRLVVERIRVSSDDIVLVKGKLGSRRIEKPMDVQTGALLPKLTDSYFYTVTRDIHREFLVGKVGRKISLVSAIAMFGLLVMGLVILLRRVGGLRGMGRKMTGRKPNKLHAVLGRAVIIPLLVTAISGVYMGLVTLKALPSGAELRPFYPETPVELQPVAPYELAALREQPMDSLRELLFPIPGDWYDVFAIKTDKGFVFVDQFEGVILSSTPYSTWQIVLEWVGLLHTGESVPLLAAFMGLVNITVPVFGITGIIIWWRGRGKMAANNVAAAKAEIVILVGSENGTTFGFARHLHQKLTHAGKAVHMTAMNKAKLSYPNAKMIFPFAATYGDGDAPQNASGFLKTAANATNWPKQHAVLAFGDRSFPSFCAFGQATEHAMQSEAITPMGIIDRQSSQQFTAWGREISMQMGVGFTLEYTPPRQKTARLMLLAKTGFGSAINTPSVILRFAVNAGNLTRYRAGDLIAIFAHEKSSPRMYSLGSSSNDNYIEICVVEAAGGLCSTFLNHLQIGAELEAYIVPNPSFAMPKRKKPVVMVGAGTGIAPFAGMIRHNSANRPIELFWGNRHPKSDYFYQNEIQEWMSDGRLSGFHPAFSRTENGIYVQDQLSANVELLHDRMRQGATVMVCGGQNMADAVRMKFDVLASQIGISIAELRRSNRYLEDIY